MVNMPCAMTPGSPTSVAKRSFQWIGLKSPDAPAYLTRSARLTRMVRLPMSWPLFEGFEGE